MSQVVIAKPSSRWRRWGMYAALAALFAGLASTHERWLPGLRAYLAPPEVELHDDHDHDDHEDDNVIELTTQAQTSIGVRRGPVTLSTFDRTIGIPGLIVERRGRAKIDIIAPLTGYVTRIYPTEGEAVSPGQALFELRLTHEELVQSQTELLRMTEELEVVRREIARLETIGGEGVVPMKTILERKYEQQKFEAQVRAQRQALILHGLSEAQVDQILKTRTLLSTITVHVPEHDVKTKSLDAALWQVQELRVERGRHVTAGDALAILANHQTLLIEGEAFEQDIPLISRAVANEALVTAIGDANSEQTGNVAGLRIAYVADRLDAASRALHVYVTLPNQVVHDARNAEGQRFIEWRFKPGQRLQLRVPVERWTDRIVLPHDAVAQDGVENYVFRVYSNLFGRQAVRVEHRDPQWVVIANDGALKLDEIIALSAAQQLQLALKNKAGGAVDPHAGHSH